jgi:hypothetical protein
MVKAFKNDEDIHAITASQIFNVSREMVTPKMRSAAKTVNFGIIYGMGAFSLAQDLKISRFEAQNYINKYRSWINSSCKFLFLEGYYKCNGRYWEESDECTFEISKWKKAKEGDARLEKKCDNACYVFETGKWRTGDATECILGLGGCTAERNGTIEKGPSIEKHKDCDNNGNCKDVATIVDSTTIKHYVCHSLDYSASWKGQGHWDIATEIEIDAYPAVCSSKTFGRIFPINNKYYICDKGTYGNYNFREATTDELTQICSSYNYGKYKQLDGSKAYLKCDVVDSNATVLL